MPEPGKMMTPIGRVSSSLSLRLNGAALAWRAQSGLKTTCWTLRVSAQQAAMRSVPLPHHSPRATVIVLIPLPVRPLSSGTNGDGARNPRATVRIQDP